MASTAHHVPLHERVERRTNADLRLFYGLGIPAALVVGLVVVLGFTGSSALVPVAVVALIALVGVVVLGINQMLSEPDEREEQ